MRHTFGVFLLATGIWTLSGCGFKPPERQKKLPPPQSAQPVAEAGAPAVAQQSTPVPIDKNSQVVVIGYHRLVDKVRHPDTEITPQDFEQQMQRIKDAGIHVIPMRDFLAWRRGEKSIPPRSAIITLDDGWNSTYDVAWPILKKFGYPFTLFIYTDYVKGGPKSGGGSLTWSQLGELRDAGADIESHTISHRDLRGSKGQRGTPAYEKWLWDELAGSKEQLEKQLGIPVRALALPYGFYNEHVLQTAAKAGYEAVFTVEGKTITYDTPLNSVGRYIIRANQPKIFADAIGLGSASTGEAVAASEVDPSTIETQPPNGAKVTEQFPLLQVKLASLNDIEPESVQMRVSGIGLVPAQYDADSKTLAFKLRQNLQEKEYFVFVSLRAGGKRVETRWSFVFAKAQDGN